MSAGSVTPIITQMLPSIFLENFVVAQSPIWDQVLRELRSGKKQTHWMWFIFPQHIDLGRSALSRTYGLSSIASAQAYSQHPVLGPRLLESAQILLSLKNRTAFDIFGTPDDFKLRSSMTLFEAAVPNRPEFAQVLTQFCGGVRDLRTHELIKLSTSTKVAPTAALRQ